MTPNPVWQGREALLPSEACEVYFDGLFTDPQLNHSECLAFDAQGGLYCGGERGEIFHIDPAGQAIRQVASTGGFTLGLALDRAGRIYSCDLKHGTVFRVDPATGRADPFAAGFRIPNFPVIHERAGALYVSDSHAPRQPGPGIRRFSLESGAGGMWYADPLDFANGMALAPDESGLYVVETFSRRISFVPFAAGGRPGPRRTVVELDALPDGLAFDARGRLYIACYEPSLVYRWTPGRPAELLYYDPEAHALCHPTNCAFRGDDLYLTNLGRWHIARLAGVAAMA